LASIGSDIAGFLAADLSGYGGEYQGNSQLFKDIAENPECYNPEALRKRILEGTVKAELDILSLGTLSLMEALQVASQTGDYTALQDYFASAALGLGLAKSGSVLGKLGSGAKNFASSAESVG